MPCNGDCNQGRECICECMDKPKILLYISCVIGVIAIPHAIAGNWVSVGIVISLSALGVVLACIWEIIILAIVYRNDREQARIIAEIDKLHE